MKKLIFIISLPLLLSSCYYKYSEEQKIVHGIMNKFSREVKKEDFLLSSYGGNYSPIVRKISLGYCVHKKTDLQNARKSLVQHVAKLIKYIDESEELRPYLDRYPYSACGIHFTIFFLDKNYAEFTDGSLSWVSLYGFKNPDRAKVSYYIYDPIQQKSTKIHQETYEEAERIVRAEGGE